MNSSDKVWQVVINTKCLNTSEPCRIQYVNLRMAIRAVGACGGFPMSVFFYQYSVLDDVQSCGSKQALESGTWGHSSGLPCSGCACLDTLAGFACLCVFALQHKTHGLLKEWQGSVWTSKWLVQSECSSKWRVQEIKGVIAAAITNIIHHHYHRVTIFTSSCLDMSTN